MFDQNLFVVFTKIHFTLLLFSPTNVRYFEHLRYSVKELPFNPWYVVENPLLVHKIFTDVTVCSH